MALPAIYVVRVTSSVFQALGLVLTTWRIYIRLKIHRFWWEDAFAAALLFTGLLWMITEWIYLQTDGATSLITMWIYSMCYTSIMALVRLSVLFSIIRIIPGKPCLLKFTYACVAYYAACWIILVVLKVLQCALNSSWHHQTFAFGKPFCSPKLPISIFQFTTDCVAILILVALPLRMLWRVKLPKCQKRMILCIFSSSVVLAFGALFHTLGQILDMTLVMVAGINVEVALSLIVCNLLVVVTFTYRFLFRDKGGDATTDPPTTYDDDFTTPLTRTPHTTALRLTTVDLADYRTTQVTDSDCTSRPPTQGLRDLFLSS